MEWKRKLDGGGGMGWYFGLGKRLVMEETLVVFQGSIGVIAHIEGIAMHA